MGTVRRCCRCQVRIAPDLTCESRGAAGTFRPAYPAVMLASSCLLLLPASDSPSGFSILDSHHKHMLLSRAGKVCVTPCPLALQSCPVSTLSTRLGVEHAILACGKH